MAGQNQPARLRLGEYPRVSRVGTREKDERLRSPDFQRELMRSRLGAEHELVPYPAELDVSGGKPVRVILDSIIDAIEAGELDGIAIAKLDRLARLAPKDRAELFERIEGAGGVIKSASEDLDASTPEGRFVREVFGAVARMELERKTNDFEVAKYNAIANGIAIMSTAPFGLRFDDRHGLEVVEHEAAVVRELFEARVEGRSFYELAELFEARTGIARSAMSIRRMLANRVYLGELRYGRTPETELVNREPGFEAIVSVELFEAVEAINRERSPGRGVAVGRAKALLAGIAVCKACGRGLSRKPRPGRKTIYRCNSSHNGSRNDSERCTAQCSIGADELDAHVIERVLAWAGPAADELREVEVELPTEPGERAELEAKLGRARAALIAYESDVELEDRLRAQAYDAGREARLQRVERLSAELAALGEATELEKARVTLRQELSGEGELDTDDRRALLSIVLGAVVVGQAPRRGAPAVERVELVFADAAPMAPGEPVELVEQAAA